MLFFFFFFSLLFALHALMTCCKKSLYSILTRQVAVGRSHVVELLVRVLHARTRRRAEVVQPLAHLLPPVVLLEVVLLRILIHQFGRGDAQVQQDRREGRPVARLGVPAHAHEQQESGRNGRGQRQLQRIGSYSVNDGSLVDIAVRSLARQQLPQNYPVRPAPTTL